MKIQRFIVNPFQECCYVVSEIEGMASSFCLIIDCGAYYPEEEHAISQYIEKEGLIPKSHLLTHAHLDHLFGSRFIWETYGLLPIVSDADETLISSVKNQAEMFGIPLISEPLYEHLSLQSLPSCVSAIPTPGHTAGSVCYRISTHDADGRDGIVVFSGDTLFQSGVGRTDLPGGDWGQLMSSLSRIAHLPPYTKVCPGHGGTTTIADELAHNPYL